MYVPTLHMYTSNTDLYTVHRHREYTDSDKQYSNVAKCTCKKKREVIKLVSFNGKKTKRNVQEVFLIVPVFPLYPLYFRYSTGLLCHLNQIYPRGDPKNNN